MQDIKFKVLNMKDPSHIVTYQYFLFSIQCHSKCGLGHQYVINLMEARGKEF